MVAKKPRKGRSDKGKSGREARKGALGIAAAYITRTRAIKRLQITLKDFRRLCILKGIYPRDPKKKRDGRDKTYYHVKDIAYLQHEPLLQHFRELKIFLRRVHRARVSNDNFRLQQLEETRPVLTLHHLLRERYPAFHLAVNDCDDALNLLCLFRLLPTTTLVRAFTAEYAEAINALTTHWLLYIIHTGALTKAFISIKGIYFQAEVNGQRVTWLMPHQFTQHLPSDVDYRVMFTFVQLYVVLMRFVLYKLYHDQQLVYPPRIDLHGLEQGKMLTASVVERINTQHNQLHTALTHHGIDHHDGDEQASGRGQGVEQTDVLLQKRVNRLVRALNGSAKQQEEVEAEQQDAEMAAVSAEAKESSDDLAVFTASEPPSAAAVDLEKRRSVFAACTFLLSREVPRLPLELLILAGGGRVVHEADVLSSSVESSAVAAVTHHVVDRPRLRGPQRADVHYVQPQWVFDSFNLRVLVPVSLYGVGVICPPHLSPFVEDEPEESGGYEPAQRKVQRGWVEGAKDVGDVMRKAGAEEHGMRAAEQLEHKEQHDEEVEDEEERYEKEMERERRGLPYTAAEEAGEEHTEEQSEEEKEDELQVKAVAATRKVRRADDDAEAGELARLMMGKKQARLYSRIQTSLARKSAAAQALRDKRDAAEAQEQQRQHDELRATTRQLMAQQRTADKGKRAVAAVEAAEDGAVRQNRVKRVKR